MTIISPFDNTAERGDDDAAVATYAPSSKDPLYSDEVLDLTWENVELVLEEMRPYLIQDGGNVAIQDIDGPVVRLELQVRRCECLLLMLFVAFSPLLKT